MGTSEAASWWTLEYLATRVPGNTRFHLRRTGRVPVLDGARRAEGLHLRATDVDWSRGAASGPEVAGPAAALVLALAGRRVGLDRLEGTGVGRLRATWAE